MMLPSRKSSLVTVLLAFLWPGACPQAAASQDSSGKPQGQTPAATPASTESKAAPKPAAKPRPAPRARRPARVPIRQARPTRDRYREIQQALADAGYYTEAIDGVWGDSSEAALKQFQRDLGLEPTGKLNALSLIRLGLGPRYDAPEDETATPPG